MSCNFEENIRLLNKLLESSGAPLVDTPGGPIATRSAIQGWFLTVVDIKTKATRDFRVYNNDGFLCFNEKFVDELTNCYTTQDNIFPEFLEVWFP